MNAVAYWGLGFPLAYALAFKYQLGTRGLWMGVATVTTLQSFVIGGYVASIKWEKEADAAMDRVLTLSGFVPGAGQEGSEEEEGRQDGGAVEPLSAMQQHHQHGQGTRGWSVTRYAGVHQWGGIMADIVMNSCGLCAQHEPCHHDDKHACVLLCFITPSAVYTNNRSQPMPSMMGSGSIGAHPLNYSYGSYQTRPLATSFGGAAGSHSHTYRVLAGATNASYHDLEAAARAVQGIRGGNTDAIVGSRPSNE